MQGEEPADAQGSEHLAGGLVMSQCFYRLPTFGKSFSIEVVRADAGAPTQGSVGVYWRQKFQRGADQMIAGENAAEAGQTFIRSHGDKRVDAIIRFQFVAPAAFGSCASQTGTANRVDFH